jgi:hypothetical protein
MRSLQVTAFMGNEALTSAAASALTATTATVNEDTFVEDTNTEI